MSRSRQRRTANRNGNVELVVAVATVALYFRKHVLGNCHLCSKYVR